MPGTIKLERLTTVPGSDLRQLEIQYNNAVKDVQMVAMAGSTDAVWSWQSAVTASLQALGRGSTDTAVASGKFTFGVGGIPESKAAVTTGLAPTAQTVPADTWAVYAMDVVTGGTTSVAPGAANATTGYATEALALAARPVRITAKARMGYYTVKTATGLAWIGATDALAGGSSGNPASQTNYYPDDGLFAPTGTALGPNGIVSAYASPTGSAWTGGRNGIIVAPVLSIGSNDYAVASTAFLYSCNGITNLNKAAVTAGTAFGITGSIPAAKWGLFAMYVNALGTISFLAAPANFVQGYTTEGAALGDLPKIFPTSTASAALSQMGYLTVQASSGAVWITGTDALAGGTTGNEAQATNYYPTASVSRTQGQTASLLATTAGTVVTSAQY